MALEIRGSRTTATRSHWLPCGGAGWPSTPSATAESESSASSHRSLGPRHDPERRAAGERAQLAETGFEQRRVAAELVDHETRDAALVGRVEHGDRAEEVREHPATVDVADHDDRELGGLCQPHVGDVVRAQVDLGGRCRALADDDVEPGPQVGEARRDDVQQRRLALLVRPRADRAVDPAAHHDLGRAVAARLEQHGVERHARGKAAGLRLHGLRTPDLAAVGRHDGVVGHVLRLERRHRDPPPVQPPAEPRHDRALARIGRRTGDQQRTPHTRTLRPGTRAHPRAVAYRGRVRFLLRPAWLALITTVTLFVIACYALLAPWQFGRQADRDAQQHTLDAASTIPPAPLAQVLPPGGVTAAVEWRQVTVTGTYLPDAEAVVRLGSTTASPRSRY